MYYFFIKKVYDEKDIDYLTANNVWILLYCDLRKKP